MSDDPVSLRTRTPTIDDERYWRKKVEMLRGRTRGLSPLDPVVMAAGTLNEIADAMEAAINAN